MSQIYTKTGDEGKTATASGERVWKDCITMKVVGEIDELNSTLGMAVAELKQTAHKDLDLLAEKITTVQRDLFRAGAEIAALQSEVKADIDLIDSAEVAELEKMMDEWSSVLPELKQFIIPGGSMAGARLHHSRTVCRRSERVLVALGKEMKLRPELCQYFNRLSDWLFTAARYANMVALSEEARV